LRRVIVTPALPFSPAADRNKHAILQVLQSLLPATGCALEIASGTGQHVAWFASHLPGWTWQPTDATAEGLASIVGYATQAGAHQVLQPRVLDVLHAPWLAADAQFDAIYCANMLHISPWATTAALMQGTLRHLAPGGALITYGPYLEDGVSTSEGNLAFDASLRAQNPAWGIRRIEEVTQVAAQCGLHLAQRHALPANNLLLVWQARRAPQAGHR
jgi:SAM-dependent methyltransferase